MRDAFDIEPYGKNPLDPTDGTKFGWGMGNRFDNPLANRNWEGNKPAMYESTESRYVTELINCDIEKVTDAGLKVKAAFKGGAFGANGEKYLAGDSVLYIIIEGKRYAIAMQAKTHGANEPYDGRAAKWFFSGKTKVGNGTIEVKSVAEEAGVVTFDVECVNIGEAAKAELQFAAVGRYDSEDDLTGKYLGEVELQMRDYHFRPRPITLGVTWTELTELVLDTSFGISAEEMLMDSAAQEIKKSLDFQAVKYASDVQKTFASDNFVEFDAKYNSEGVGAKDSYWHQAQLVNQAIGHVEDNMLNAFNRGGVTAIVGGPKACRYLELNEGWSNKGAQPKIGGHKVGELNGIPVFKVPANIIPDNQLITSWKNDQAEGDVAIAIGTLMPFYSTGALQRKNLYKEACVARFEDTQALQPKYLGRIQINNIQ